MFLRPKIGEVVFNLEVFNGMAVAQDLGQQRPQLGDVPLTVAQVVDEAALRLFFRDVEVPVEGGVGRADPQALVEDHEWLSQGRNDVVGVGKGVPDADHAPLLKQLKNLRDARTSNAEHDRKIRMG
jgi:hypothetical protein